MTENKKVITNSLICLVALMSITAVFFRERILPKLFASQAVRESLWTKEAQKYFDRKTAQELKELLDIREKVTVVDLRSRADYATEHIPTAKNIPMDELEARMFDELPQATLIVLYCECPTEASSNIGYRILFQDGYDPAVLTGGLTSWKANGFRTESSPKPTEY